MAIGFKLMFVDYHEYLTYGAEACVHVSVKETAQSDDELSESISLNRLDSNQKKRTFKKKKGGKSAPFFHYNSITLTLYGFNCTDCPFCVPECTVTTLSETFPSKVSIFALAGIVTPLTVTVRSAGRALTSFR